jgi:hypothetical protein
MLPKPDELRGLSERFIQAVEKVTAIELRKRLAAHALTLAQVAEQLERGDLLSAFVHNANVERYERLLAGALDEETRAMVERLLAEEDDVALQKQRDQAKWWQMRAEELRATANQFAEPSAHEMLLRAAANYEQLANHAEGLVTGKPKARGEKAG